MLRNDSLDRNILKIHIVPVMEIPTLDHTAMILTMLKQRGSNTRKQHDTKCTRIILRLMLSIATNKYHRQVVRTHGSISSPSLTSLLRTLLTHLTDPRCHYPKECHGTLLITRVNRPGWITSRLRILVQVLRINMDSRVGIDRFLHLIILRLPRMVIMMVINLLLLLLPLLSKIIVVRFPCASRSPSFRFFFDFLSVVFSV